ncbi:hypothetical protein [Streptomyces sp. Inha503]|uniref:hypothetical protein n=1 Tax=Streptomyces sp. Inha503 TaxID=3383314 RepID=UPI00399F3DE0
MTAAAPAGAALLPVLHRLQLRFESSASQLLAQDVSLSRTAHDDSTELTIFSMSGLTLELSRIGRIYDSLDSRDSDYEHFARLFDSSGDLGLHPDLDDCLVTGTHVVIIDRARIDRARIASAWRGLGGVGRLLIARMLRWTSVDAAIVATHPFPIDIPVDERDDEARVLREKAAVQRTWESLGFEPFREDLWVMKPRLRGHEDAVRRLEATLAPHLSPF